jgi:SnoaL-like domain
MTTDSTTSAQHAAQTYLATWNATDPEERRRLLDQHWTADVTYVDPLTAVSGRDGVSTAAAGAQEQFPDFVFSLVGEVDAHHNQLRFQWGLGPASAEPVVIGFDVLVLDQKGRIKDVRGFLDRVPA